MTAQGFRPTDRPTDLFFVRRRAMSAPKNRNIEILWCANSHGKKGPGQLAELVTTACDPSWNKAYLKVARVRLSAKHRAEDIVRQAALVVLLYGVAWTPRDQFQKRVKPFGVDVGAIVKAVAKQQKTATEKKPSA